MKQVLLLALTAVAVSQLGVAASCSSGSLATYLALGSSGCTIGGNTLSNFTILTGLSGGTPIAPSSVTLNPMGSTFAPGLTISTSQSASAGVPLEAIFTYDISGPLYNSISAMLSGSSETVDGAVTGIVNFCEGGMFGPDGVSGCASANGSLLTLDGTQNMDSATFSKIATLAVTDDLTFDPGLSGTATGGTFTNSFTAVPEPLTSALAVFGFALVGALRVRSLRTQSTSEITTN